jgi:hypothetical protein
MLTYVNMSTVILFGTVFVLGDNTKKQLKRRGKKSVNYLP